jgi:multidrug efflux system membrane fusion protein
MSPLAHAAAAALSIACLLAGCGAHTAPPPQERLVRTVVAGSDAGAASSAYTGEIRSRHEADLSFQVSGKLIRRAVEVGTVVSKGAVLAQLDDTDARLSAASAAAAVSAASAEFEHARVDEARYRDLLERGLTTRAAYLAQLTAVKTGQSRLEQATSDQRLSSQRLSYTTVRADDDGIVTRVLAETGAVVAAGQAVVSVARLTELDAVFDVPDSRIEEVRAARAVQVALLGDPHAQFLAQVREIAPGADPVTRTYRVKATIEAPPAKLHLGMSVAVTLPEAGAAASLALPATALFQRDTAAAVWVVKNDRTLELRGVRVERYDSERVVLAAGLKAGERVVTAGVHRLAAGERVRLLEEQRP